MDACESPGTGPTDCGAGIPRDDARAQHHLGEWYPRLDDTFNAEISDWDAIGFDFSHTEATSTT